MLGRSSIDRGKSVKIEYAQDKGNTMSEIGNGKSVLIVEDCQRVADDLYSIYERLGFNVAGVAKNGLIALDMLIKVNPDLISLDIIMPEMDGIECFRKMQGFGGNRRYIFISALSSDSRFTSCYSQEIPQEMFLPKPVSATMLEERLKLIFSPGFGVKKEVPVPQLTTPPPPMAQNLPK